MENSAGTSVEVPGVRARIAPPKAEPVVSSSENFADATISERDASSFSVRYNSGDVTANQPIMNLGTGLMLTNDRRGNSLFDVWPTTDEFVDEECLVRSRVSSDSSNLSRCGSWPGVYMDNFESLFDCNLSITNIRKPLEPKTNISTAQHGSSRYVEAAPRTFSRRSRKQSPKESSYPSICAKEKSYRKWMKLVKSLRVKKCTSRILTGLQRRSSTDIVEENKIDTRGPTATVDVLSESAEVSLHAITVEEQTIRSPRSSKQYARFRPISIANGAKRRPYSPVNFACNQFPASAVVKNGKRTESGALNYELFRIRDSEYESRAYDCIEKETGKRLTLKIIPKDHAAAPIYEELCTSEQPGLVRVTQVLEDKELLYILIDIENGQYLKELYESTNNRNITENMLREIVKGILEALVYLHRKGTMHGSVNMDSIMIRKMEDGKLRGELIHIDTVKHKGSKETYVMQNTPFEAPELRQGILSCSSDLWSIGVILYMFTEGRLPFQTMLCDDEEEPRLVFRPSELVFTSDRWVKASGMRDFCMRCLQHDHSRRISSAMEALIHRWFK
ncbi:protein kinase domain containing protein [Babesia gibsoni]|uniref:Protein kinase domain containing protein n=1 Tax=Babesia gibsoni TaxID=33632 RepID=A0AAD8LQT3_BABGI|nr:protein kinase domain containing protein [Babesia gibsoni]